MLSDTVLSLVVVTDGESGSAGDQLIYMSGIRRLMQIGMTDEVRVVRACAVRARASGCIDVYDEGVLCGASACVVAAKNDAALTHSMGLLGGPVVISSELSEDTALVDTLQLHDEIIMGNSTSTDISAVMKSCAFYLFTGEAVVDDAQIIFTLRCSEG